MMRRCLLIIVFLVPFYVHAAPLEFQLTYDGKDLPKSFSGRVHVQLTKGKPSGPPGSPNWFRPEPMLARDVRAWKPGETVVIGSDALAFPEPLAKLAKG